MSKLNSLPDLCKSKLNSLLDLCKSKLNSLPDLCKSKLNSLPDLCKSKLNSLPDLYKSKLNSLPDLYKSNNPLHSSSKFSNVHFNPPLTSISEVHFNLTSCAPHHAKIISFTSHGKIPKKSHEAALFPSIR